MKWQRALFPKSTHTHTHKERLGQARRQTLQRALGWAESYGISERKASKAAAKKQRKPERTKQKKTTTTTTKNWQFNIWRFLRDLFKQYTWEFVLMLSRGRQKSARGRERGREGAFLAELTGVCLKLHTSYKHHDWHDDVDGAGLLAIRATGNNGFKFLLDDDAYAP